MVPGAIDKQDCLPHCGATIAKPAPLIIAFRVLAVLGALVWYTEENPPETGEPKPEIVSVEEDDIVRVTISRPRKDTITLQRGEDGEWRFGEPYTFPVGESPVNTMISNLASMNADRLVDEHVRNWAPYGLNGAGELEVSAVVKQEQPGEDEEGEKEAEAITAKVAAEFRKKHPELFARTVRTRFEFGGFSTAWPDLPPLASPEG